MKVKLSAGAEIDLMTQAEMYDALRRNHADTVLERARGVKWMRLPRLSGTLSGTYPTSTTKLGGPGQCGPQPGYAWALRRLAAINLSASTDQLYAYRNEVTDAQFIATLVGLGATNYVSFTNVQAVLFSGDQLIIAPGATFAATGTITVTGEAVEVPAQMLWKVA